jgi:acetolactate synthase-1/3 small subunit
MQTITNTTIPSAATIRTGCSDAPQGTERVHTLVVQVVDRPGSVDRVIGVLRRRRARLLSFNLHQSETPNVVRITALVKDTEVGVEHLFEHVRKIVDVCQAEHMHAQQAIMREMALVNVSTASASAHTIIEAGQQFGAVAVETSSEFVTLEVMGTEEEINAFLEAMHVYGVGDVARSGCIALARS